MAYFLAKTDPETYSIEQFEQEKRTVWDGVRNAAALLAIRKMQPGDMVLLYLSGGHSAIVALATVLSEPRPDPNEPKSWVVDLEFVKRLITPVTLGEVKSSGLFNDWALVRQSRLSTMPVPDSFIDWLREKGVM